MKNVILIKNPKNWGLDRNEVLKKAVEALDYEMRYFGKSLDEVLGEWMKHGVENLLK